jgi:transposase
VDEHVDREARRSPAGSPARSRRWRPDRPRRAAPHPRTDPDHQAAGSRDRRPGCPNRPHLLTEPGFGLLTAAKLVGEIAGAQRFASDAKLARAAGIAPIPVSSGKTDRHRLDRGGNRQINATIHRIAVTRLRCHPETQGYIARITPKTPSAASSATSPDASGTSSKHPRQSQTRRSHPQALDIGAASSAASAPPASARASLGTR